MAPIMDIVQYRRQASEVVQDPGRSSFFIDFKYSEPLLFSYGDGLLHFSLSMP